MLHAVIMAGGAGTRFWPVSRREKPKQLLNLTGESTLLQETVARFQGLIPPQQIWVLTNQRLVAAVAEQLPSVPSGQIIGEPCKRDTAPCIGLAALLIARRDPSATMCVSPADHVLGPAEKFREAIAAATQLLEQAPQALWTFGVRPTYPAETFGYIERGEPWPDLRTVAAFRVVRFKEKPNRQVAQTYLEQGNYYWNSGIFVWHVSTILEHIQRRQPVMFEHLSRIATVAEGTEFTTVLAREFPQIPGISIDYAVMEHAHEIGVIEAPFSWDDVGSWQAIARLQGTDAQGNTIMGRHLGLESERLLVRTENNHLVVTIGVEDLIVVHTPDATLIARKDLEEQVRRAVQELEQRGWTEYL